MQDAKIEAIESKVGGLISSEEFMGMEGKLEDQLHEMKLEMHKKEDKISRVSAEFERVKEHVEKLKDLKIRLKRTENTLRNGIGMVSQDLANLKTVFELLRLTSSPGGLGRLTSHRNHHQGEHPGPAQELQKGARGTGNGAQGELRAAEQGD